MEKVATESRPFPNRLFMVRGHPSLKSWQRGWQGGQERLGFPKCSLATLISSSTTRNTLLSVLAGRDLSLTMNRFPGFEAMQHQVGQSSGQGAPPGVPELDARAADRLAASQERDFKLLCLDDGMAPMNGNRYYPIVFAESRNRGIAESRNRGIAESRNRGIAESRNRGIAIPAGGKPCLG